MSNVIAGLIALQNRGYDSAGIACIENDRIVVEKTISGKCNAIDLLTASATSKLLSRIAIGHTRWATHGNISVENAHPHHDANGRFALVHNGIIENYLKLKAELQLQSYKLYGQTDTEIMTKFLDYILSTGADISDLDLMLTGSWAILMLDQLHPNRIYFWRNGSPLIIGFTSDYTKVMFVSEFVAFDADITHYFILRDGEHGYAEIADRIEIKTKYTYEPVPMWKMKTELSPEPYPHWTLKEIYDQPEAINRLLADRWDPIQKVCLFPELPDMAAEHIILLACGTSFHAAQYGLRFFKEFRSPYTLEVIDGADFELVDLPVNKRTIIMLLSQSGETKDLYRALTLSKDVKSIGIINVENSLIAREVDYCLYLRAGREHAVASTKSFTNQVLMLLLLAMHWCPNVDPAYVSALETIEADFARAISLAEHNIPEALPLFDRKENCFVLGKHYAEWIAKEASLKIKEISYIHSEGYSAASLKHGPFALITAGMPIIFIVNNDRFYSKVSNAVAEVKARGATVILITNVAATADHVFHLQVDSTLFPLISIVPMQMLAYQLALRRAYHPDFPRNLAKVVTVE